MSAHGIIGPVSALLAAASICIGSSAYGQVVTVKGKHSETILQNSSATITLVTGNNPLDTPTPFTCKSAKGCVVLMSATLNTSTFDDSWYVCAYVDGVAGIPTCPTYLNTYSGTRQQLNVSQGSHTVSTSITDGASGEQIMGWETDYTIYEIR
jgi:hypothetical protein